MKLLVNAPTGFQEVIEVNESGSYFDESRVLWDERDDGELPPITLGGMFRSGDSLVFDQAQKDSYDAASLVKQKAFFISKIDADADALIRAVIGERASEYEMAEKEATDYKLAGYAGTVTSSVQSWATAKGWTAMQAADDILAAATGWRSAQAALRAARLLRKEQARVAVDAAALGAVQAQWDGFMVALKENLGVQ